MTNTVTKSATGPQGRQDHTRLSLQAHPDEKARDNSPTLTAWRSYRQFEGYSPTIVSGTSPPPQSFESRAVNAQTTVDEFLHEFDQRATAAVAAGCVYTDTILAFKLLDKCQLVDDVDIEQFLDTVPTKLLNERKDTLSRYTKFSGKTEGSKIAEEETKSSASNWSGHALLSLVKTYVGSLLQKNSFLDEDEKGQEGDADYYSDKEEKYHFDLDNSLEDQTTGHIIDDSSLSSNLDFLISDLREECSKNRTSNHLDRNHEDDIKGHSRRKHECQQCDRIFATKKGLTSHMKVIHDGVRHPCNLCDLEFATNYNLTRHQSTVHEGGGTAHHCDKCAKQFPSEQKLFVHKKSHHKGLSESDARVTCDECDKTFLDINAVNKHKTRVHGVRYPCDQCGKVLHSIRYLRLHQRVTHDGVRLKCNECGQQFRLAAQLARHQRAVHSDNPVDESQVCDKCGQKLKSKQALNQHKRKVHDFRKYYSCSLCDYAGKDTVELRAHVTLKHEGKKLPCDQCDYQATSLIGLYQHRARHKSRQPVTCDDCGLTVMSRQYLAIHKDAKHGGSEYSCTFCSSKLDSREAFRDHLIQEHNEMKESFLCDKCDYVGRTRTFLYYHKKTSHKKHVMIKCSHCAYETSDSTRLRHHIMSRHEGVKFPCDQCDFQASTPNYLVQHKNADHYQKRYHCDKCDFVTKQKYRLKMHSQAKHDGIPFPCDECERKFSNQIALNKHKKLKHGVGHST